MRQFDLYETGKHVFNSFNRTTKFRTPYRHPVHKSVLQEAMTDHFGGPCRPEVGLLQAGRVPVVDKLVTSGGAVLTCEEQEPGVD